MYYFIFVLVVMCLIYIHAESATKLRLDLVNHIFEGVDNTTFKILHFARPTDGANNACSSQMLLAINLSATSEHDTVKLDLQFSTADTPKLWTVNIGESIDNKGKTVIKCADDSI